MDINEIAKATHENALKKGFWENPNIPEKLALVHAEVSEALEEYRDGYADGEIRYSYTTDHSVKFPAPVRLDQDGDAWVQETDVVNNRPVWVRLTSTNAGVYGYKAKPEGFGVELADAMIRIIDMATYLGIDLEEQIRMKMAYNETRPYKHGKVC